MLRTINNVFIVSFIVQSNCQSHAAGVALASCTDVCARTARRHTLPVIHRRTCGVRTSPNSPGLNPVDCGVWGALQQMVYQRRRFTTINQLKQAIVTEWGKLLERFIDGAIGQWRRRLEWVVLQQGEQIEHLM